MRWQYIPGWTDGKLLDVYDWAIDRAPSDRPTLFVEVGVAMGRSLTYAAERIAMSGKEIELYGVDLWIYEPFMGGLFAELVEKHHGFEAACRAALDGVSNATLCRADSVAAAALFSRPHFVFIDTDHSYERTLRELRAWWPLIATGGALAGHDHDPGHPGVIRACEEYFGAGNYEVVGECFRKVKT